MIGCGMGPSSPLNEAAGRGDIDQIRNLAAGGANVNAEAAHGITPISSAARAGAVESIPVLVNLGADPNQRCGVNGWTPLMHAIHKQQLGSVRALLEAGANVNERGDGGENPLMMAAGYGYTNIVNTLLDRGADPLAKTPGGMNALDLAVAGVMDIDRFTAGDCQASTIEALAVRAPALRLEGISGVKKALLARKLKGCTALSQIVNR